MSDRSIRHLGLVTGLVILLAGCTGTPASPADQEGVPDPDVLATPRTVERPTWQVGDWWDVRATVDLGNGILEGASARLVATPADEDGYLIGSDDPALAILDAYFDMLPIGPVGADLALTVADDYVELYRWPLAVDTTWTTAFFVPMTDEDTLVATNVTLTATDFDEHDGRLRIQGATDHGESVDYDYDPASGWMTYFRLVNASTGRILISLDVTGHGEGFTGTVHAMRAETVYERIVVTPPCDQSGGCDVAYAGVPPVESFSVDDGAYDFVEEIHFLFTFPLVGAGGGHVADTVVRPDGAVHRADHTGAGTGFEFTFERRTVTHGFEGSWIVSATVAGTGGAYLAVYGFHDMAVDVRPAS